MRISDWSSDVCSSDLGIWDSVAPKVARAENVRAALALVERSAAPFGIVYATDATASRRVKVAGVFPEASHPAITYPIALLKTATSSEAASFRQFMISCQGQAIRSEEHTSELQALMRNSYAVFCLHK